MDECELRSSFLVIQFLKKRSTGLGFHLWKRNAAYSYYDTALVKRVRDNLRQMRQNNDADGVRTVLEVGSRLSLLFLLIQS